MKARQHSTRDRLLQVAEDLSARKGFAGAFSREIGAALGIAKASIIHHFPSKAKLYAAVRSRIAASVRAVMDGLVDKALDPAAQMRLTPDRFAGWGEAHPGYLRLSVREPMENAVRLSRVLLYLAGVPDAMRQPFDRVRQEGVLPDSSPALLLLHRIGSITTFTLAEPTISRITPRRDAAALRRRFRETLHRVLAACLAPGPARSAPAGQEGK